MRIGIDAMGGDFAPQAIVAGTVQASRELPDGVTIVLFGDQAQIEVILKQEGYSGTNIEIIHAPEVITMSDHPAKAFQQKTQSSIVVGFGMLAKGKIDSFASAGNTGAMMVGTMFMIKAIEGIIRPVISGPLARLNSNIPTTLLDVGLNADCKPEVLYQYGILGSIYANTVWGIENPRVGLLNIGEEEEKGNLLTKATHELMKNSKDFNFVGNVEGNGLLSGETDVVVCDGFSGNIVLKLVESLYTVSKDRGQNDEYFNKFNYENEGGTPVLGVNAPVLIGHGVSNANAIKNLVFTSKHIVDTDLVGKIKKRFSSNGSN